MISINSLELHISYHCNLSCKNCMHMSPLEKITFLSKEQLNNDLNQLKGVVIADEIRLLGGEPLLNKELPILAMTVKKSQIGRKIMLSTNGILLNKWIDSELWDFIDECEVSIYESVKKKKDEIIEACLKISRKHSVTFYIYYCDSFRQAGSFYKSPDFTVTRDIFETCLIAKKWQCFNLFEGRFYLCPQAIGFSRFNPSLNCEDNSISLYSKTLEKDIHAYINRQNPLPACEYCYGCVGMISPHMQIAAKDYLLDFYKEYNRELIDVSFLQEISSRKMCGFYSLNTIKCTMLVNDGTIQERV